MAGKMTNFAKQNTKRNTKRNAEPMYMRSKNIGVVNEVAEYNTEYSFQSAWKANVDNKSSDKLFLERRDLIGQWYMHWSDTQRKRFFDFILERSAHSQLKFILGWFKKPVRVQQDFVTVLPRVVSTHILSYLDPRSLCRAACVSWHWKWLADQDVVWKRKCLKFGWYLPYQPSELENGAWKKHYVMCLQTINIELPKKSTRFLLESYGKIFEEQSKRSESQNLEKAFKTWKKKSPLVHKDEPLRPPWVANSFRPKDLEQTDKEFFRKTTETKPQTLQNSLQNSQPSKTSNKHSRSKTTPNQTMSNPNEKRLGSLRRSKSEEFNFLSENVDPAKLTLSEIIKNEMFQQMEGVELDESNEHNKSFQSGRPQSSRMDRSSLYTTLDSSRNFQEISTAYPNVSNPRVLFISSKIPACEAFQVLRQPGDYKEPRTLQESEMVLVNAMLYGILPIVYDYDGTTLSGLLENFTKVLKGRKARSVGFFVSGESGTIDLVRGSRVSLTSLGETGMQTFWQTLGLEILNSTKEGGHVDIFYPLGGTDVGIELLAQLQILTELTFSSPTGTISSMFKVDDDWLPVPEDETPPNVYFSGNKLLAWSRAAEYIEETMCQVQNSVYGHFENELDGLASKVIGEIIFKAFGLSEVSEIQDVSKVLIKALILMTQQTENNKSNPTSRFIKCLQECHREKSEKKKRSKKFHEKTPLEEKQCTEVNNNYEENDSDSDNSSWRSDDNLNTKLSEKVSLGERRAVIAHELLSSERDYCYTLTIIQDVFRKPLEASIKANRPVIGASNIRMIFNDSEVLLKISKELVSDLSHRLQEWDSHQCLADVFLKFNTKLKAYMNFLNNYPITLSTIEKCRKQHPAFRIFLLQLKQQPCTKLMSLQTLLLAPTKRIDEYVCLLEAFLHHTSIEHKDKQPLKKAIEQMKKLKSLFDEATSRLHRERRLREVQKLIINSPALLDRSRFFIKQEDVIHLKQADSGDVKPEFRVFQNIGDIGLFLFNDCLVITTKDLTSLPFQRTLDVSYKYHVTLPLLTTKLEDIADSKYIENAFMIVTPKRQWVCQAKSKPTKINWMSLWICSKRTSLTSN